MTAVATLARRKKKVQTLDGGSALAGGMVGATVVSVLVPVAAYLSVVIAAIVLLAKAGAFQQRDTGAYGYAIALVVLAFVPTFVGHGVAFAMACAAIHLLGTTKGDLLGVRVPAAQ
jgi:hypothetical protein